jgi:exopolyphosphatase/guanosine-5'-triphosphate,3'-diphosphate pyrophosphatase
MPNIITSIDLGSNSFRVLKFDCKQKKSLCEFDTTVGTADGLSSSGNISQEALTKIIVAIKKSIEVVDYEPTKAVAVTTHALRLANNSKEILETIKIETGVAFTIIDGKTEGQLTLLSMQNALKRENLEDDNFVLLDIGGGSTELIIYQDGKSNIHSFSFGIVTLSQSTRKEKDLESFEKEVEEFLERIEVNISNAIFISTAGTPVIIAALKHGLDNSEYDKYIINGTTLSLDEVKQIQEKLNRISKDELIVKVGTGREKFVNTGMLIYQLFFKTLKKDISVVFDDGLREGVALAACGIEV